MKGARPLSFPDITADELAKIIPTKHTRVLIYRNNNFENAPAAFSGKGVAASLNIYTFNTLHSYGYDNVYELGPPLDIGKTKLPLVGAGVKNPEEDPRQSQTCAINPWCAQALARKALGWAAAERTRPRRGSPE